ncbi:MAG: type II toxin-antitoxin system RelE/ParE family toxin [Gallionellaceae bacterium]|jgi:plasmid stabilization system protein ParE|nr:type II toxin-antitoxin system RelE/ParE family toxin [Gallionellaceae bacterium]
MSAYTLTAAADADVSGIIRYTRQQWGTEQARSYHAKLKQGMTLLALRQGAFKDLGDIYPTLRVARCEHHYLFCLPRENAPALIIAVLHERMDLMMRLADRLK